MSLIAQIEEKIVTLDGQTDGQDQAMLRTYICCFALETDFLT